MASWQRPVRLLVLASGLAVALVVYTSLRPRETSAPPARPTRMDPHAVLESTDSRLGQFSGLRKDFSIQARHILSYQDGTTRLIDVEITTTNSGGRVFVVAAREARASRDNVTLELRGGIALRDDEGFALSTEYGVFNQNDGTVGAAGDVAFSKGSMRGSGRGMAYDQHLDVLTIVERAQVDVRESDGVSAMRFTAGSAVLDRRQDQLALSGGVHVEREGEVADADRAVARLSPAEDVVTFIELRERASVTGAAGIEAMRARDIDLDYTDDGTRLEAAALSGDAVIAVPGERGAAAREFGGERLDVALDADASVRAVSGAGAVWMSIPAAGGHPARRVRAERMEAIGAGGSFTAAVFRERVAFEEDGTGSGERRTGRSRELTLDMASGLVTRALFAGEVAFSEGDLRAQAHEARYQPDAGTLQLTGVDRRGGPTVSDPRLTVSADAMNVGLGHRRIEAAGRVRTVLRDAGVPARAGVGADAARLPGLLERDEPVHVTAGRLAYESDTGRARYSDDVWLWQAATEIRADTIDIDRESGDLSAIGSVRSVFAFEAGRSEGRAEQLRYSDEARRISLVSSSRPSTVTPAETAALTGPQGHLRAERIELLLAARESRMERLEASRSVTADVDARTVTGHGLTYTASGERYDVTGAPGRPAMLTEPNGSCVSEITGNALTFTRSADTMTVDGQSVLRTATKRTCRPASR